MFDTSAIDLAEHSPLTGLDELPIHQFPQPVRVMASSDPRAYERYWFTAHDVEQQLLLITGFGFYPNLGTAEAYAIFVHDGKQTTVRAHRRLGDDRTYIGTGPLRGEVVSPFREWHLTLDDNPQGLTFDVRWCDTKRAIFQRMGIGSMSTNVDGRLAPEMVGYESFGRIEGTVTLGGQSFRLDPATAGGSRDHHWGVRDGVGGIFLSPPRKRSHLGQWVEFGDWSIWDHRSLRNLGDLRPGADVVQPFEYRLRFDEETRHLRGGVIRNRMADGSVKEVVYEPVGDVTAHMRCGMYAGVDADTGEPVGTPEEGYFQGSYAGETAIGGETFDITDSAVRRRIGGFEDMLVIAECDGERAVGILECRNPLIYQMCVEKIPGFGFLADS